MHALLRLFLALRVMREAQKTKRNELGSLSMAACILFVLDRMHIFLVLGQKVKRVTFSRTFEVIIHVPLMSD